MSAGVVAALLFVGITSVAWVGADRPLWLDEAFVAHVVRQPIAAALQAVAADSGPPLYYLAVQAWCTCFGTSELALRTFSLLSLAVAAVLLHRLARAMWPTGATSALVVFSMCQPCLRHAQNARMYTTLLIPVVLVLHLSWRCVQGDQRFRTAAGLAVTTMAGLLTHYWFGFVVSAQMVAVVLWWRSRTWRWVIAVAAGALGFAVMWGEVVWRQLHSGATAWLSPTTWADLLRTFADFAGGAWPSVLAAVLVAALLAVRRNSREAAGNGRLRMTALFDRYSGPLVVLFLGVTVVPWAVSFVRPLYFVGRYTVLATVPLALLVARFISTAPKRLLQLAGVVFAGVSLVIAPSDSHLTAPGDDRSTANALLERATSGDVIVFTSLSRMGIEYYLDRQRPDHGLVLVSFPPELARHPGWRDFGRVDAPTVQAMTAAMLTDVERRRQAGSSRVWLVHGFAPDEPLVQPLLAALSRRYRVAIALNVPGLFYSRIDAFTL